MKKNLLALLLAIGTMLSTNAQFVTIPDTGFVSYLQQYYPGCMTGNVMDTTCLAICNETHVSASYRHIANFYGLQYFDRLQEIYAYNCGTVSIPALPPLLKYLYCGNNSLVSLPALPSSIELIHAERNQLTSLPSLPAPLKSLYVGFNNIQNFPTFPTNLQNLDITANNLNTLPILNSNLLILLAPLNNLTSLPPLPQYLSGLEVSYNQLTSLPTLPTVNFRSLYCSNNAISSLPILPPNLESLNIGNNLLTDLQQIPDNIQYLFIDSNQLTVFPNVPHNLYTLNCEGNYYTTIPALPNTVGELYCGSPYLTSITNFPENPDNPMMKLSCTNSPNLLCLPHIGPVSDIILETGITCLPNYLSYTTSIPFNLNALFPLCDSEFNSDCPNYANISGQVFADNTNNCYLDTNEHGQPNLRQELWSEGTLKQIAFSGQGGFYSFDTDVPFSFAIVTDTVNRLFDLSCANGGILYDTLTVNDSIKYNKDYALQCAQGFNLVALSVTAGQFRPAGNTYVNIHAGDLANLYNMRCALGVSGNVTVSFTGPVTYLSSAGNLAPNNVNNNTITWNIPDFGTSSLNGDLQIVLHTDTFAQIGQQVCFTVKVTPTSGDNDTMNNILTQCFPVVNSYDPNDKQVYPLGIIDTAQEWLTYTVRFQNTGSAEALNIHIMDTLDTEVIPTSLQLLSYSHQPNIRVNENIVRFNFPNINLPDSNTNEPGSHGYVQYKVKIKENLPIGSRIDNTAYIYFDYNPAVITNTVTSIYGEDIEIGLRESVRNNMAISIYPNPATHEVTIVTNFETGSINVYNTQGKQVYSYDISGTSQTLNVADWAGGVYYIEVNSQGKMARKKFVKL